MTLTTHAVAGATVAELFPSHPVLAFSAGFISHLAIDFLPHWDYKILSLQEDKKNPLNTDMILGKYFLLDLTRIGFDAFLGLILSLFIFGYFFNKSLAIALIGAVGAFLPDALQFVYWKSRSKFLLPLQRFHIWVQEGKSLHIHPLLGLSLQLILIVILNFTIFVITKGFA